MASSAHCLSSSSSFNLSSKLKNLSLNTHSSCTSSTTHSIFATYNSLSFSTNLSHNLFFKGSLSISTIDKPTRHLVICEVASTKKPDSAAKRARQAEKRRLYNKARKSEVKTRMKKVLEALDGLKKKPDARPEEVLQIEKLIGDAYSIIDKAVKVGTLHRNTGARRKSRLARRKKAVEIHHGWYTPVPAGALSA
ncbi:Ribosomal_S20p domain-containing protein [Cephalotus follicularis]|uniref:Small ribosomal subunit protein bS20c n=1 Tax=Cephalotus follicularis TaxID=3775 RepID=A0A1Q3DBH0_CEPFO|nr:Ribosomal_S20p domain-containing protein [Cephalotus follicularis]